jgi:hypothetical protein
MCVGGWVVLRMKEGERERRRRGEKKRREGEKEREIIEKVIEKEG